VARILLNEDPSLWRGSFSRRILGCGEDPSQRGSFVVTRILFKEDPWLRRGSSSRVGLETILNYKKNMASSWSAEWDFETMTVIQDLQSLWKVMDPRKVCRYSKPWKNVGGYSSSPRPQGRFALLFSTEAFQTYWTKPSILSGPGLLIRAPCCLIWICLMLSLPKLNMILKERVLFSLSFFLLKIR
jgi:hypothetical protein